PPWCSQFYSTFFRSVFDLHSQFELKHNDNFLGYSFIMLTIIILVLFIIKKRKDNTAHNACSLALLGFLSLWFFMLCNPEILILKKHFGFFPTAILHFIPGLNNMRIPERF